MEKNTVFHKKARHIKIKFHFLHDTIEEKEIDLMYCKIDEQLTDIFTKALRNAQFKLLWKNIKILEMYINKEY